MRDERAVSVTVGYVLNLAIVTVLFSALLVGGSGLIDGRTQEVTRDELTVAGQGLAAELSGADRLARAGNVTELSVRVTLPERTTAGNYAIEVNHSGDGGTIELRTTDPDITVRVPFRSETPVANGTVRGGTVRVAYDGSGELAVVEP